MTQYDVINSLSGFLILTSLLVIEAKNLRRAAILYSVQSMVLVLIFLALAADVKRTTLLWAASAFVTKVLLVPFILIRAQKGVAEADRFR
jgi:hydrogenase-4 component E